jgi:serine palmitoyltransferase
VTEPGPADQLSWLNLFFVYVGYGTLVTYGYMREYANRLFGSSPFVTKKGYAPLLEPFTYFWMRYLYGRISDCWNRPIDSCPGAYFNLVERGSNDYNQTHFETGKTRKVLNLGSYNYLGFAENKGEVLEQVIEVLDSLGASTTSTSGEVGYTTEHVRLEGRIAEFVGKDAAMIFGMGYATNSTTLPALVGKGSLIISDHNNHASLVVGCRTSSASTRVFRHNDPEDLERVVRDAIISGQPRTHRPWRKIVILVEGIYSMEGEVLRLAEIIAVKKKYNCYLYVDEAHSIGALGKRGRGIVEYWDCDPADVDILMGTFTKSFGSVGGYIAGDQAVIDYLRQTSLGTRYAVSMSPPCVRQAEAALAQMESPYGLSRIERLHSNSNYFRERLGEMGFQVAGDPDSPVVPMFLYHPTKMPAFSRLLLDRGIAIVVVGFPATPLILSRCRFCISAAHTKEDLDVAIDIIAEVGDLCMLRYCKDGVVWRRPLPHDRLANLVKFA